MEISEKKPELLLPAGSPEAFYAAIDGGADAIYLGLKSFSARARAKNFALTQVPTLIEVAHKSGVKIYLTLNTVIKNKELHELISTLDQISALDVDAIIIQDWGVFQILSRYFPQLRIHASTQMANHNSAGARFSEHMGFERVIFARELTHKEIEAIRKRSTIGMELFVHGALCYSFSGMCLFSSYLGGYGANRGQCAQPCRRLYQSGRETHYTFSLKDNQLIRFIPDLIRMGIDSLKIEGRMKPAEYVHTVARAYRMALDSPDRIDEAESMLQADLGREKTAYFFGGRIDGAITDNPNTGLFLGHVLSAGQDGLTFNSGLELEAGSRIRIHTRQDDGRHTVRLPQISKDTKGNYRIPVKTIPAQKGDAVFLAGGPKLKFPSRIKEKSLRQRPNTGLTTRILKDLRHSEKPGRPALFIRIDSLAWLRKINLDQLDGLILKLSKKELEALKLDAPFLIKNRGRIWIELPKFIPESSLPFYREKGSTFFKAGFKQFMLSHLSQGELLPDESILGTTENVYVFNDAVCDWLNQQKIREFLFPFENDMDNLLAGSARAGIVPLYFFPELFYARMPVQIDSEDSRFQNDQGLEYRRIIQDGLTRVIPDRPVALFQYKKQLKQNGFNKFLIDLSYETVSKNRLKTLLSRYHSGSQIQPSTSFNFKKILQ